MSQRSSRAQRRANKIRNRRILLGVIAVLIIALAAYFIYRSINSSPGNISGDIQDVQELVIEDLVQGEGPVVKNGDTVQVHYTGWLTNGNKFDSSLDRGQPFKVTVGAGAVIKGWDQGLLGMQAGGKRRLTIPAELAYGNQGVGNIIPANATLIFEIELLEIQQD